MSHRDKRNVPINIPINTNNDQHTIFYESKHFENPDIQVDAKMSVDAKRYYDKVETLMLNLNSGGLDTSTPLES